MAVGARDKTDKKLVKLYANVKTMSDDTTSKVDPDQMLKSMSLMAMHNRNFINFNKPVSRRKSDIA